MFQYFAQKKRLLFGNLLVTTLGHSRFNVDARPAYVVASGFVVGVVIGGVYIIA